MPRFYAWGMTWGAIALPSLMGVPLSFPEYRSPWVALQAMAILAGILIMLYGGNTLTPALNAAQEAIPAAKERVDRLRRRAVWLNHAVLVLGVGLIVAFANRPAPRTSGIVEMTPRERAQYDQSIGRVIEDMEARQGLRAPKASSRRGRTLRRGRAPSRWTPRRSRSWTKSSPGSGHAMRRASELPQSPARESHTSPLNTTASPSLWACQAHCHKLNLGSRLGRGRLAEMTPPDRGARSRRPEYDDD